VTVRFETRLVKTSRSGLRLAKLVGLGAKGRRRFPRVAQPLVLTMLVFTQVASN